MHRAIVLEQTSRLRHRCSRLLLLSLLVNYYLPIPGLHQLINRHVFLHFQLFRVVLDKKDLFSIGKVALVTCLSSFNPLKFFVGVGCQLSPFLFKCQLLLLFLVLDSLMTHPLLRLLGRVDIHSVLFDVPLPLVKARLFSESFFCDSDPDLLFRDCF